MTPEELLKPRYRVIADYPDADFKVGYIFPAYEVEIEDEYLKDMNNKKLAMMANYPHLFEPLNWWQERTQEEMPKYVKYNDVSMYSPREYVCLGKDAPFNAYKYTANNFQPATKEEYETHCSERKERNKNIALAEKLFIECFEGEYGNRKLKVTEKELQNWIKKNT